MLALVGIAGLAWALQPKKTEAKPSEIATALAKVNGIEVDLNPALDPANAAALARMHSSWSAAQLREQSALARSSRLQAARPGDALHPYA